MASKFHQQNICWDIRSLFIGSKFNYLYLALRFWNAPRPLPLIVKQAKGLQNIAVLQKTAAV